MVTYLCLTSCILQTCLWYLRRWSDTYLHPSSSDRAPLSASLQSAYGPGPGAQAVLTFLVGRAHLAMAAWHNEDEVRRG